MANTYTLIASNTVSTAVSSITFSSIPATYTDLCIKITARSTTSATPSGIYVAFNGNTATFGDKYVEGNGATVASGSIARYVGTETGSGYTANTFSNVEVYIPNYANTSYNKSFSADGVSENNATTAYATFNAGLWSNTSAINQVTLTLGSGDFAQYSTAYLYGIKNS